MLRTPLITLAAAATLISSAALTAHAQDASALVDALVKKGVLTDREAEEVRADLTKPAPTDASKIKLSSAVTELKLYGDIRMRYQYDEREAQVASPDHDTQRSRWRFRLRLNADVKLTDSIFAGVALETGQASDSANQTFENGFDDYNIYIAKAYIGWAPSDAFKIILGKQTNPFYTTDLVWDPDINPQGFTETIAFHKLHWGGGAAGDTGGYSKDGKSVAPAPFTPSWELSLVAGQFFYDDNAESAFDSDASNDAYLFVEQLIASYKFAKNASVTFAPGFMSFNAADLSGFTNENQFSDTVAVAGLPAISGETRKLNIITAPGDVSFKLGSLKTKLYWDFAYNLDGKGRFEDIYQFGLTNLQHYSDQDAIAWLVGLQLGETKKKGDWTIYANYRETGIASIDPNLNDNDFAFGELNTRGIKVGLAWQPADAVVVSLTGMFAWNLSEDLTGGRATNTVTAGNPGLAQDNSSTVVQVDVNVKF